MSKGRSTACIALSRTNSQPCRCAWITSPAKTRVISLRLFRVTFSMKSGLAIRQFWVAESCTGLPSIRPQVLRGSPISRALWKSRMVRMPAMPGLMPLGPPENPAKKCGSMNPVTIRKSAST